MASRLAIVATRIPAPISSGMANSVSDVARNGSHWKFGWAGSMTNVLIGKMPRRARPPRTPWMMPLHQERHPGVPVRGADQLHDRSPCAGRTATSERCWR